MGKILRAVTNDGTAKISVITAPDMVERAREIHHLHPVGTAALGRTLCGASLLGEMLKEDNAALTLRIQGGGPIGTILAVSDNAGNVRGYVSHPEVDLPIRERTASSTSPARSAGRVFSRSAATSACASRTPVPPRS